MSKKVFLTSISIIAVAVIGLTLVYSPSGTDFEFESENIESFESEEEFQSFIATAESDSTGYAVDEATEELAVEERDMAEEDSETDTVVEPETVTEDGESIYYSSRFPEHMHVVDTDLQLEFNESGIGGELILTDDRIITVNQNITAYSKQDLEEEWVLETEDSRLEKVVKSGGELKIVTRENVDVTSPCPVRPASGVEIACSSIYYHPSSNADYTYNIMTLDIETGEINETAAFTADWNTEIEITSENIYAAYSDRIDESEVVAEVLKNSNTVDQELKERIEELQGYDISERSMQIEIERAVEKLTEREGEEIMEELEQEISDHDRENMRNYETSKILKFDENLESQEIEVSGGVDNIEYLNGKIAVTSSITGITRESENDLHLVEDTEVVESRENIDERIRSIESLGEGILVQTWEELKKFDSELNEVSTVEAPDTVEVAEDMILGLKRSQNEVEIREDRETEVRGEIERSTEIIVLDEELEELHSKEIEERIYNLGEPKRVEDRTIATLRGANTSIIEIDEGIEIIEIESNPSQIFEISENLYMIERNSIIKKDMEYEILDSIELHTPRPERHPYEPVLEPQ